MRNTLRWVPHKLPPLQGTGGSPIRFSVEPWSCLELLEAQPWLRFLWPVLRWWVYVLPKKQVGCFLPLAAPSSKRATVQMLTIYKKFRHSSSPSTTRVMSKDSAIQGSMPCLPASQLWEDLPCWMFQIFLLPGSSAWAIFLYSSLITGTLLQRKSRWW